MAAVTGKLRTRGHVLADLGVNYAERQALLCGNSVQRVQSDYGYDLIMSTYNAKGEIEGGVVFFQVKATEELNAGRDGTIRWTISRRDLKLWLNEAYPVVLVVYLGKRNRAYWLHIQAHLAELSTPALFAAGESIQVRMPMSNRLNRSALQKLARLKNDLHQVFQRRITHD